MKNKVLYYKNQFKLSSTQFLSEFELSYQTYGKLNKTRDNCILIFHALTGDCNVSDNGWWSDIVGSNKVVDTNKFFVVCSTVLGSCKGSTNPSSINPETQKPYYLDFPSLSITDMVNAQKKLLDHLEIKRIHCVIGGSMGGMLALKWSILFSEITAKVIVIASACKLTPQALAFNTVAQNAIIYDSNWKSFSDEVSFNRGLAVARMIGHITYLSKTTIEKKFGRNKRNDGETDDKFEIENYLKYQGEKFMKSFDPYSYVCLAKAMANFDLEKEYESLEKAFMNTSCKFLILSISSDWLYPSCESRKIAKQLMRLNKEVTYTEINSEFGHDSFLIEQLKFGEYIQLFI